MTAMTPTQLAAYASLNLPQADVTNLHNGAQVWMPNGWGVNLAVDPDTGDVVMRTVRITESGPEREVLGFERAEHWAQKHMRGSGDMDVTPDNVVSRLIGITL